MKSNLITSFNGVIIMTIVSMFCVSCDSAYTATYIYENTSDDTISISFTYGKNIDTTIHVMPNERKTFFTNFIVRDATTFGDCCPCSFTTIKTNDPNIEISNSSNWLLEKQNEDKHNKDGYVNCLFKK